MRHSIALAGAATAAIALGAALLASLLADPQPAPVIDHADSYIAALDAALGWPVPDDQHRAQDLTVAGQICAMLGNGWNEAGVVANMLTWPGNRLTPNQLAVAVHVTHRDWCGQPT